MLARLLQAEGRGLTMIFCQTKRACDRVAADLVQRGFDAAAVHGDLGQSQRERALHQFRNGRIRGLIATDIAARGIDIDEVTHVVNFELPNIPESYVHRIGRTARAGAEGIAISLCSGEERAFLGDAVDVGGAIAHHAAIVGADVPVADVVGHDDEDVGLGRGAGLLREGWRHQRTAERCERRDSYA